MEKNGKRLFEQKKENYWYNGRLLVAFLKNINICIYKLLFEYMVMPFGLTNAPASYQKMMDEIFEGQEGTLWYLDDILIHGGETEEETKKLWNRCLKGVLIIT